MWQLPQVRWTDGSLSVAKTVVFHSANVRSRWTPAGVTTSWHEPHISDSLRSESISSSYALWCAGLSTGFRTPPRIV